MAVETAESFILVFFHRNNVRETSAQLVLGNEPAAVRLRHLFPASSNLSGWCFSIGNPNGFPQIKQKHD